MAVSLQTKQNLVKKFGESATNTGKTEVQIAILTAEIVSLTEHMKINKKDTIGKRGLHQKVSKRRSLLTYLERNDVERYRKVIKELGLRR